MLLLLLNQPVEAEEVVPGLASGSGISPDVTGSITAPTGQADGAGVAPTVTGTAPAATSGLATGAGIQPSSSGTSPSPTVGLASGAGVAPTVAGRPVVIPGLATGSGASIGAVDQFVSLGAPRAAEVLYVGGVSATFVAPVQAAVPVKPNAVASFVRPGVSASFEQANTELVLT